MRQHMDLDLLLIGIEDTDTKDSEIGTGKLTRLLGPELPEGAAMVGMVRHQLLLSPEIPYTSWNSPACAVIRIADEGLVPDIAEIARRHIRRLAAPGSNPGLCVAMVRQAIPAIMAFGVDCRRRVVKQKDALEARGETILEGLGGDNGGIIGALGAVGLTAHGWCGRFIELTAMNERPLVNTVGELAARGVHLVVMERDAPPPPDEDLVVAPDSLRPKLIGGVPALLVHAASEELWETKPWPRRKVEM